MLGGECKASLCYYETTVRIGAVTYVLRRMPGRGVAIRRPFPGILPGTRTALRRVVHTALGGRGGVGPSGGLSPFGGPCSNKWYPACASRYSFGVSESIVCARFR